MKLLSDFLLLTVFSLLTVYEKLIKKAKIHLNTMKLIISKFKEKNILNKELIARLY